MAPIDENDYTRQSLPGLRICFGWVLSLFGFGATSRTKIAPADGNLGKGKKQIRIPHVYSTEPFLENQANEDSGLTMTRRGRRQSYL